VDNELRNCASSKENRESEVRTDLKEALLYKLAELTRPLKELDF
jgi:hypothetical protein